jgi:hypothetical protein
MPLLTPSSVHIDQPLTNLTIAFNQEPSHFIADQVFPLVSVSKQSDKYYIYNQDDSNRAGNVKKLAPRTEVERIGLAISNDAYFAEVYGLGADFSEQDLANEDTALEIRSQQAFDVVNQLRIHREQQFADTFFKTGVWGTEYTGVAAGPTGTQVFQWSDYTNSTPIVNITTARRTSFLKSGGFDMNTMVVDMETRDVLINHPDILARLNGGATVSNTALITNAKLAEIFEVENFFVMKAVRNSAAEGLAASNGFISTKKAMLVHGPKRAGLRTPAAGLTFCWDSIPGASGLGITVETFSDDALKRQQIAEMIQVKMAYDMKVTGPNLGVFFNTIVA